MGENNYKFLKSTLLLRDDVNFGVCFEDFSIVVTAIDFEDFFVDFDFVYS